MTGGCSMTSARLLAEWTHRPGCSCSRTSVGCSLQTAGVLWPESLRDWPPSGSWDATGYYEHPTSVPPTDESGCSSLLGTPTAHERTHDPRQVHHGVALANQVAELLPTPRATRGGSATETTLLLPTPQAREGDECQRGPDPERHKGSKSMGGRRVNLDDAIAAIEIQAPWVMLPTPTSRDWKGRNQRDDDSCLPGAVLHHTSTGDPTDPPSPDGKP